jgi:hypothetical protein
MANKPEGVFFRDTVEKKLTDDVCFMLRGAMAAFDYGETYDLLEHADWTLNPSPSPTDDTYEGWTRPTLYRKGEEGGGNASPPPPCPPDVPVVNPGFSSESLQQYIDWIEFMWAPTANLEYAKYFEYERC